MSNYRNKDLERYSTMFKALSNPHRLQIYNILAGCCDAGTPCATDDVMRYCVGELDQQLDIASSTLSHHLKELHRAGLIHMQRKGRQVYCSINPETLDNLGLLFASHRTQVTEIQSTGVQI